MSSWSLGKRDERGLTVCLRPKQIIYDASLVPRDGVFSSLPARMGELQDLPFWGMHIVLFGNNVSRPISLEDARHPKEHRSSAGGTWQLPLAILGASIKIFLDLQILLAPQQFLFGRDPNRTDLAALARLQQRLGYVALAATSDSRSASPTPRTHDNEASCWIIYVHFLPAARCPSMVFS
ncbi:hypothetical protein EVG20_g9448, partial [Dentipellis fragilis]